MFCVEELSADQIRGLSEEVGYFLPRIGFFREYLRYSIVWTKCGATSESSKLAVTVLWIVCDAMDLSFALGNPYSLSQHS